MTLDLYGIFGNPLTHSLSPAMQESAFSKCGIQARYLVLPMDQVKFRRTLSRLKDFQLKGFNITIPYKEKVMPFLDEVSEEARRVGAVNTVYRRGHRWAGTNTDVYGFLESLRRDGGFKVRGKRAVVFGAGGAARAAVYGLASAGALEVAVFNRDAERALRLTNDFRRLFPSVCFSSGDLHGESAEAAVRSAHLVVNATSVGLKKADASPVEAKFIPAARDKKSRKLFYDLIYAPAETAFLLEAKKKGHAVLSGAGMLVYQGAKAFEFWTGRKAPVETMKASLLNALATRDPGRKA